MELSPSYDLMSTIIHTPNESDTALELFDKDIDLAYYATYGHYGRIEFIEFAKRLGIVEIRYLRIIEEFFEKKAQVFPMIEGALLSNAAKQFFSENLQSRLERLK
jgi:serine/threonine-protein kinase HipA